MKMNACGNMVTLFTVIGLPMGQVFAELPDWPQFRGPNSNGIVEAKNPPTTLDFENDLVWETKIPGRGWSSPVMMDGILVVTSAVLKGEKGKESAELRVIALDAEKGGILWNKEVFTPGPDEVEMRHRKNTLASSSALLADGMVYAHFGHMGTAALKLKTGEIVWKFHETYSAMHGNGGCPVLADGVLVFSADGTEEGLVRGLDAKTGKLKWEKNREMDVRKKFSFATPIVLDWGDQKVVASPGSGMVGAYRPKDGKLLWSVRYGEGYSVVPKPVFHDDTLYLSSGFNRANLIAIDLSDQSVSGDLTDTKIKWSNQRDVPKTPSFVVGDSAIYMVEDSGRLTAVNKKDGEKIWNESLRRNFSASLTMVGNKLYSFTEEGQGYVHEVSPEGAKKIAENEFGEPVFASPIIFDNGIIVRSETKIRRFQSQ